MSTGTEGSWDAAVDPACAGMRLDRFVAERSGCSRARAREMLDQALVEVDGRSTTARDKGLHLAAGQRIRAFASANSLDRLEHDHDSPLVVLAQGPGWVAVDKPAGVAVHPLRVSDRDTLLQRVAARWPQIEGVGEGGRRSGVVHRLDVDTSGVQLFAFEEAAWLRLRSGFAAHRIDKVYRAIVRGTPPPHGSVELDLVVTAHRPARVRVLASAQSAPGARRCSLRWRVLESWPESSLIEVRPRTGFLHQVRVSFAEIGHPLLGDALYGGVREAASAPRHMLHATAICFEEIDASSGDPADFLAVLARLREG